MFLRRWIKRIVAAEQASDIAQMHLRICLVLRGSSGTAYEAHRLAYNGHVQQYNRVRFWFMSRMEELSA